MTSRIQLAFYLFFCAVLLNAQEKQASPAQLLQHFDASIAASVETNASNVVTAWHDQSENAYIAVPVEGDAIYPSSKTFSNGMDGIDFRDELIKMELLSAEDSDTILNQADNPSGFCIITAVYVDSIIDNWNDILGNNSTVDKGFFIRYSANGNLQVNLGGVKNNGSKAIEPGQPVIFTFNYDADAGAYKYWCSATDEELVGSVEPRDFSSEVPLTIGATNGGTRFFDGMVGEVLVYNTSMAAAELLDTVYALGDKWGIDLPRIPQPPNTRIVETNWSDDDVAIIQYNAAEAPYNADRTGVKDATEAIQRALDDCNNAPGGVVYLPEGTYRIDGNLIMGDGVTLRGDWKEPTDEDKTVAGTILNIYGQKGEDRDSIWIVSPIEIGASGGIRDLTIYYPEQDVSNPIPYPFTVRARSKMLTVMNVTLVNSYKGIRFEKTPTSSAGHPNAYNVYGSPLKKGIRLNKAAAVPRIVGIDFDPSYWAESGLPGAPSEAEIFEASRSLESVGLELEQSDNGIIGNVRLRGYDVGIGIGVNGASSNMKVYDFDISGCRVGVYAVSYKSQGWTFTKGLIDADGDDAMAVYQTGSGTITFNDVAFKSTDQLILSTTGSLSFTNCHFVDWASESGINLKDGELISYGNIFSKNLSQGQSNILLSAGVDAAAISGNTFENSAAKVISNNTNTNVIVIDTTGNYDVYRHNYPSHEAYHYFIPAKTDVNSLFNVKDYGAVADMVTDNTTAFKDALNAANENGGGTVYIPGGAYRIDGTLTIPTGVELRGVHDLPVYTGHGRSILMSYVDKENPGDEAFITMEEASGIRGMMIMRPEQVYNEADPDVDTLIYDWPYAIRAAGDNCCIVNISVANADKGIDLASPGGGHYINWYLTAPIRTCLNVLTGTNPIVVDNMQTNPGLFRDIAGTLNWNLFTDDIGLAAYFTDKIAPKASESRGLYPSGTAVNIKGDGAITFYSNFYNNPFNGYVINGSPVMKTYLSGGEGEIFYSIESEGNGPIDLEIIANTYHPIETDPSITGFGSYQLNPDSEGTIKVLNTTSFGAPNIGYRINNGNLIVQSAYQTVNVPTWVEARGDATVSVEGCFLRSGASSMHGVARDDSIDFKISGSYSENNYRVSSEVQVAGSTPNGVSKFDVLPPSKPTNFQADSVSTNEIFLSWDSSTDNINVAAYHLYRDNERIAELTTTNFSDTGLTDSTRYVYFLMVFDESGNANWTDSLVVWTNAIVIPDDTTGIITSSTAEGMLKIYPNPSKGEVYVSLVKIPDQKLYFEVYSVEGTLLRLEKLLSAGREKDLLIDLGDLGNGIYIYRLVGTRIITTGKILIDK